MEKLGRIAFITTPEYRKQTPEKINGFVYRHLYSLCNCFEVLATGRTYDFVMNVVNGPLSDESRGLIARDTLFELQGDQDLMRWRQTIEAGLFRAGESLGGMIEITYQLVEGHVNAVLHFTDWADVMGKPDSMVLRREANVHEVPISHDIDTAEAFVARWNAEVARTGGVGPVFRDRRKAGVSPLDGIVQGQNVLALIAHDRMKLAMCQLVVEYKDSLFNKFDYILATGTTGDWVRKFLIAAGRTDREVDRVRCCLSGPFGGDVQIATAVVRRLCGTVVFLQDPHTSHAHSTDIMLFEQAVLLFQRVAVSQRFEVKLATNLEGARVLLSS